MANRTPLHQRKLPNYTSGEESFNTISHGFGALISLVGLLLLLVRANAYGDTWSIVSATVYGITLIFLYSASTLYHGLTHFTSKRVLQIIDHCAIFLLIAGSYTPMTLGLLRRAYPTRAWIIFAVVWISAIVGIILNSIDLKKYSTFSMITYLAMGWCVVLVIKPLGQLLPPVALWLLALGGIAYTVGALFYGIGKKRFSWAHGVFHIFVLIGSILHFFAIYLYILPV